MRRPHMRTPRGAALPLSLILLGVLTAVAVAAVSLSGQERVNAGAYSRIDFVQECATAAQAKLWAELAYSGTGYLGTPVTISSVKLPDGSLITAPAHYDQKPDALVKDVVIAVESSAGTGAGASQDRDCTNNACGMKAGQGTQRIVATCVDQRGRALEIELSLKFNL